MSRFLDLSDRLARLPIAYNLQPVRGTPIKHEELPLSQGVQYVKQNALAEGPWGDLVKLWTDAFEVVAPNYQYHPGTETDTVDTFFPDEALHPWTAWISAKVQAGLTADQADKLFGIYQTLKTPDFNASGQQIDIHGDPIGGGDPRNYYFFKPNPANCAIDQIIRWGQRPQTIINFPAWCDWRDYNDEVIDWDDAKYTPRNLSITPTTGGTLSTGVTYYIRVSTIRSSDESSASQKTVEISQDTIVLSGGQNAFQVSWIIKGDEENPAAPPGDISSFRVYVSTSPSSWSGYFVQSSPVGRTLLITTLVGATPGSPLDQCTSGLLRQIPRFECGLFFLPPYTLAEALDRICQISCADWQWSGLGTNTYRNDKIRFLSPANRTPVFSLDLAQIAPGSFKTWPLDRRSRYNQIIGNFRDKDDPFLAEGTPVILDREQMQEDDKQVKSLTIEFGTAYRSQVQRTCSFWARMLCDLDQMASLKGSPKSYFLLPGDTVEVTPSHVIPDWDHVEFLILKKEESIEGGVGDTLTMKIYSPSAYSDTDHSPLPSPLPKPKVDPLSPPPIIDSLILSQIPLGLASGVPYVAMRGQIQFQDNPAGPFVGRVWVQGPDDVAYRATHFVLSPDPTTLQAVFEMPVSLGLWKVKVVTESSLGVSLPFGDHTEYTITISVASTLFKIFDNVPPTDVDEIGLGVTVGVARATNDPWYGAQLNRDRGYGYEIVAPVLDKEAFLGHTDPGHSFLPSSAGTLYVVKEGGPDPVNATLSEITKGKNNYFVGREKLGVQTWTNLGGGVWQGTGLVRGLTHTYIFQSSHTVQEDVMLLNENSYFIPVEKRDMNNTLLFKAVSYGLLIGSVTAFSLACRGDSVRAFAADNLVAFNNSSQDWDIGADGNPRMSEIPESYIARLTRVTGSVFLREIPIKPGINLAASLTPMGIAGNVVIAKNNVYVNNIFSSFNYARSTQQIGIGSVITARVSVPAFGVSGSTEPSAAQIFTGPYTSSAGFTFNQWELELVSYGHSLGRPRTPPPDADHVRAWYSNYTDGIPGSSDLEQGFLDIPAVNGIVFVRIVYVGTEIRIQLSGSPIVNEPPVFILRRNLILPSPNYLDVGVLGGTATDLGRVENIYVGGLGRANTIYSKKQQEDDNAGTPIGPGDLQVEFWEVSPNSPTDYKGFSVKQNF